MTSLEKAKAFLKRKAVQTALVIVPLAAAASSAHASTVFTFNSGQWTAGPAGGVNPSSWSSSGSSLLTLNGVQGVKVWGSGGLTYSSGGVATLTYDVTGNGSGGAFSVSSLPVLWDFSILYTPSGGIFFQSGSWTLTFLINGTSGGSFNSFFGTSGGTTSVSGIGTIPVPNGSNLTSWEVILSVQLQGNTGDSLAVTIPSNSIDLNAVPEPASCLLIPVGTGAILLLRRRRRKEQVS